MLKKAVLVVRKKWNVNGERFQRKNLRQSYVSRFTFHLSRLTRTESSDAGGPFSILPARTIHEYSRLEEFRLDQVADLTGGVT